VADAPPRATADADYLWADHQIAPGRCGGMISAPSACATQAATATTEPIGVPGAFAFSGSGARADRPCQMLSRMWQVFRMREIGVTALAVSA